MIKVKSILLVCTGNSCRSIMAEGLFKKYLKAAGKDNIEVRSAGIMALDGFPPTDETIKVMEGEDVDVSGYRSMRLTADLIINSDLILAMEDMHKDYILKVDPSAADKTYLLKKFEAGKKRKYPEGDGVPDPIGKQIDFYKLSLGIIKEEAERIVGLLQ